MRSKFAQLSLGVLTVATSLSLANSVQAVSFNLTWTGNANYSMTGIFSGNDGDNDGLLQTKNSLNQNEITSMNISFFNPSNTLLATYDLNTADGNGYTLLGDTDFNFNFQISPIAVLQNGSSNQNGPVNFGLSLGDGGATTGYTLTSSGGIINFSSNDFTLTDSGGTVGATAYVPFEFTPSLGIILAASGLGIYGNRKKIISLLKSQNNNNKK